MKVWPISVLLLMLCAGCGSVRVHREYADLKQEAKRSTGADIFWQRIEECIEPSEQSLIDPQIVSRDEAVRLALQYNPQLQAQFEELGIAKADLRQAGFYTNPRIDSIFRLPTSGPGRTNIEVEAYMNLSDAWQVPLRRHVAYDQLEITTMHILRLILDLTRDTKLAYIDCVFSQKLYEVVNDILKNITALRDRIYFRQNYGFSSELDKAMADMAVGYWQTKLAEQAMHVKDAFLHLRRLLGATVTWQPLKLTGQLSMDTDLPDVAVLQGYALEHRPEMHIASWRIEKAKHTLSLEKANVLDNVIFGAAYKRDFEFVNKGIGPIIGVQLPVFNTNLGKRERARFEINQAQQERRAQAQMISQEVQYAYIHVQTAAQQIIYYTETVLPASERGIEYTQTYFDSMQLNMIVLLDAYQSMLGAQQELVGLQQQYVQAVAKLERAIAHRLDQWNNSFCSKQDVIPQVKGKAC